MWTGLKFYKLTLPNDKFLDWSIFKALVDDKIIVTKKQKFTLGRAESIVGKRRKCWLPAFSPFPTMFTKAFLSKGVKSRDCLVTSEQRAE